MITIFENYNNPDLRRIDDYVMCIKNYKNKDINFEKGKSYKVISYYGDPQGAIEKYGIIGYIPVESIYNVCMFDNEKNIQEFHVNKMFYKHLPAFLDYFYVPEFTNDAHKYNI